MLFPSDRDHIAKAAAKIKAGNLVVFPSETVYGLGADATNDKAVAAIFEKKGRPTFNPLIIHVLGKTEAALYGKWDERAEKLAERFWPGPLTLVLPRRSDSPISHLASSGLDSVALRAPAHPIARQLLSLCQLPLAGPSANPSGSLSPTEAAHVEGYFPDLPILQGGPCHIGLESSVLSLLGPEPALLRQGVISAKEIGAVLGSHVKDGTKDREIRSPGQMLRHYAPRKPLRMNVSQVQSGESLLAFGVGPFPAEPIFNLSAIGDLKEAAAHLFAMLHEMDRRADIQRIAVMPIPNDGLGRAINDRLARAEEGSR